jgi:hypothetical protein
MLVLLLCSYKILKTLAEMSSPVSRGNLTGMSEEQALFCGFEDVTLLAVDKSKFDFESYNILGTGMG